MDEGYECHHCGEECISLDDFNTHLATHYVSNNNTHRMDPPEDFVDLTSDNDEEPAGTIEDTHEETLADAKTPITANSGHRKLKKCPQCAEEFSSTQELNQHILQHGDDNDNNNDDNDGQQFKCSQCKHTSYSLVEMEEHIKSHNKSHNRQVRPNLKDRPRLNPTHLVKTEKKPRQQRLSEPLMCSHCSGLFYTAEDLEHHILSLTIHGDMNSLASSTVVDLTGDDNDDDDGGGRSETNDSQPTEKTTESPPDRTDSKERTTLEDECAAVLKNSTKIDKPPENTMKCPQCTATFTSKTELDEHTWTHITDTFGMYSTALKPPSANVAVDIRPEVEMDVDASGKDEVIDLTEDDYDGGDSKENLTSNLPVPVCGIKREADGGESFLTENGLNIQGQNFQCSQCTSVFESYNDLHEHELMHTGRSQEFKCAYCDKVFSALSYLEVHMKNHSVSFKEEANAAMCDPYDGESEGFQCSICGKNFETRRYLSRHMRRHKTNMRGSAEKCHKCGQWFLSLAGLRNHAFTHAHEIRSNQCALCYQSFTTSSELVEHLAAHAGSNSSSCPICGQGYVSVATLRRHLQEHVDSQNASENSSANVTEMESKFVKLEGQAGFSCTHCGDVVADEAGINRHMRKHMKNYTSTTYYETKCVFNKDGTELNIVSRLRRKRYKCYLCGNMFRRPSDLARHMMIHTGERPFPCVLCTEGFIQISHLKLHVYKAHRNKPVVDEADNTAPDLPIPVRRGAYPCCGQRFTSLKALQYHWLVHKEEAKFECIHCGMRFTKGFARTKHMMHAHAGAKPKCSDCGKMFRSFRDLQQHLPTHENQLADMGETTEHMQHNANVEVYTDVAADTKEGLVLYAGASDPL